MTAQLFCGCNDDYENYAAGKAKAVTMTFPRFDDLMYMFCEECQCSLWYYPVS